MKKFTFSFLFILSLTWASVSVAQTRYLDPVFSSVDTTNNVTYGVNFSIMLNDTLPIPTGMTVPIGLDDDGNMTYFTMPALELDVFQPAGDTEAERPLIIYLHTGTFAPIIRNGNPTGSRQDYATQVFCTQYAARGYVVANTDYRLGWNPGLEQQAERGASLMRAAFRGIQDVKAAIRFFRKDYENGNTYGIDTSRIIICGQGTGGWIATCLNSVDKLSELQLPKFLDPITAYPLIDTSKYGDWDGFGGDSLLNMENHKGYSSDHDMILNMGGAIGDISWLEAGDKPIAAVHGNLDEVALFTTGNLIVTTLDGTVPIVDDISGSYDVVAKANSLGNNNAIPMLMDDYTIAAQNASNSLIGSEGNSGEIINQSVDNLFPFITGNAGDGAPWDYFDSTITVSIAEFQGLPASVGTAVYLNGLTTNPDMSSAKSAAYIDSTLNFFCPRIVNALMLSGNSVGINKTDVDFKIYPNPASDFVSFNSISNINELIIYDNTGKLIKKFVPNQFTYTIDIRELPDGIYHAEIITPNNTKIEKFVKN